MSRSRRCAVGFIVLVALLGFARAKAEQLPIRTYTTADGLARDRVYKIVSDPHGFLWFCTYDGLSRFDGYEFVNYSVEDGLPHRVVYDLLITRAGEYWVATAGGVARLSPYARKVEVLGLTSCCVHKSARFVFWWSPRTIPQFTSKKV